MHPVIFLWAHPRSMSTAIERVMRERGDLECLHEPFLHYYYLQRSGKDLPHFDSERDHPSDYAGVRELVMQRAEHSALFVKDMSYYVVPEILQDRDFCRRIRHCFLVRNPMRAIMSYYRLDKDVTLDEIGVEAQWMHLQGLQSLGVEDCIVLEAEAVQADPVTTMRRFWQALGLKHVEDALHWDDSSTPQDWQYVEGWHQAVSASKGIQSRDSSTTEKLQEEFEQMCRQAPQLAGYLQHHLPFYERLRDHGLGRA